MTTSRPLPLRLLLSALLALASAACTTVEAAPPADLGPMVHVDFTRSAAELAALGDVTDLYRPSQELPAHYQIIDSHITVPQRPHFEGSKASSTTLIVSCMDDGGYDVGSYVVDDVHGEEGQRGAPASRMTHGEDWTGPLGVTFSVRSLDDTGAPGAPFSALVTTGPYAATGFTARITLRAQGTILAVP